MLKNNDIKTLKEKVPASKLADIRQLNHSLGFLLSKVTIRITELHERIFTSEDLSPKQYGILTLLCQFDGLTQIDIGRRLDIDRSTMVALVDDLEGKNMIIRTRDPKDRRAYLISNTEKGRKTHTRITDAVTKNEAKYFNFLEDQHLDQLRGYLREILSQGN
ncbi:MAG: MarR family transcriptional regulator [Paracoccaceae bacterium]